MKLGNLAISQVVDGIVMVPKHTLGFAEVPEDRWAEHRDLLVDDHVRMDLGGFLIGTGDRVILVDLGLGSFIFPPFLGGELLHSLRKQGVGPEDVTDVVLTHLHDDHVGWASTNGEPTFPNATYRCHQADWDTFVGTDADFTGNITLAMQPVCDRIETWSTDRQLFPGIDTVHAPGHSPGSTILVLSGADDRAMILGDVVHCPIQLVDDEWAVFFDADPEQAAKTRSKVIQEIEGTDTVVSGCHFPGMRFGRLLPGKGKRMWSVGS